MGALLVQGTILLSAIALQQPLAHALVLKTWESGGSPTQVNDTAPADDPGWHNTSSNRSAVYLGNQWMLTAKHAVSPSSSDAGTVSFTLPGGTYQMIANSRVDLTNPAKFGNITLTDTSDLSLFRINPHPTTGLTPEAQDPLVREIALSQTAPAVGDEVLMIGSGRQRLVDGSDANGQFHWDNVWATEPEVTADYHGFLTPNSNPNVKAWGKNKVAQASSLANVSRLGENILVEFGGSTSDVIGMVVQFDRGVDNLGAPVADGSLDDETQAASGDSGGPLFYKNLAGNWVLGGLMHAIYLEDNQPANRAAFGNHTAFSDLSQSHYRTQIEALVASNLYSTLGDIDLDGLVTGGIVGGLPTGDLAALLAGWDYQQAEGDIVSWKQGDLNQDGLTDLSDFVLLRDALGGTVSVASFATLVAGQVIPEPSSLLLLLTAVAFVGRSRRG